MPIGCHANSAMGGGLSAKYPNAPQSAAPARWFHVNAVASQSESRWAWSAGTLGGQPSRAGHRRSRGVSHGHGVPPGLSARPCHLMLFESGTPRRRRRALDGAPLREPGAPSVRSVVLRAGRPGRADAGGGQERDQGRRGVRRVADDPVATPHPGLAQPPGQRRDLAWQLGPRGPGRGAVLADGGTRTPDGFPAWRGWVRGHAGQRPLWAPVIMAARSSGCRNDGGGGGPQAYRPCPPSRSSGVHSWSSMMQSMSL